MSYRIEYGGAAPAKYRESRDRTCVRTMTAVCLIVFTLAVGRFWPRGQELMRDFLLPGAPTVTEQAFSGLVSDLYQGMNLEEALTAFCRQIVDHGAGESD